MHTVLHQIVPGMSLLDFLTHESIGIPQSHIIRTGDPVEYVDLVKETYVSRCPESRRFWAAHDACRRPLFEAPPKSLDETMYSMLFRLVETLVRSKSNSVLAKGYRCISEGTSGMWQFPRLQNVHVNAMTQRFLTKPWTRLLQRTGGALVQTLLTKTLIFVRLPNGCFIQASGPPLSTLYKRIKSGGLRQSPKIDRPPARPRGDDKQRPRSPPQPPSSPPPAPGPNSIRVSRNIFYGECHNHGLVRVGLPSKHVLGTVAPTEAGARRLIGDIFGDIFGQKPPENGALPPRLTGATAAFRKLISNHRHCRYCHLFLEHCRPPRDKRPRPPLDVSSSSGAMSSSGAASSKSPQPAAGPSVPRLETPETTQQPTSASLSCYSSDLAEAERARESRRPPSRGSRDSDITLLRREWALKHLPMSELLQMHTPPERVAKFVRSVLTVLVPRRLWGSKHNFQTFQKKLHAYLSLKRFETMTVHELVQGVRVGDFACFRTVPVCADRGRASQLERSRLVSAWFVWLMESIVQPLVRTNFYCTEGKPHKSKVLYYPRLVWQAVQQAYCESGNLGLAPVSAGDAAALFLARGRKLGFGRLRLLPRLDAGTVRPITNLASKTRFSAPQTHRCLRHSKPHSQIWRAPDAGNVRLAQTPPVSVVAAGSASNSVTAPPFKARSPSPLFWAGQREKSVERGGPPVDGVREFWSVNSELRDVFDALKFEAKRQPGCMGASIFGYDDFYNKYCTFLRSVRRGGAVGADGPRSMSRRIYVASVDVSKCFDTIKAAKLVNIVRSIMRESHYCMHRFAVLFPVSWSADGNYRKIGGGKGTEGIRLRHLTHVYPAQDPEDFFDAAQTRARLQCRQGTVLVDKVSKQTVPRVAILDQLRTHVFSNIVKLGCGYYRQEHGIPQGSILSAFLCCCYLSDFENAVLLPQLADAAAVKPLKRKSLSFSFASRSRLKRRRVTAPLASARGSAGAARLLARPPQGGKHGPNFGKRERKCSGVQFATSRPGKSRSSPCFQIPGSLLVRQMDDYLLLSTSRKATQTFVDAMLRGSTDYCVNVNPSKTKVSPGIRVSARSDGAGDENSGSSNAASSSTGSSTDRTKPPTDPAGATESNVSGLRSGADFVPWNGLLIDPETLEVRADYQRFCRTDLRNLITVEHNQHPGESLLHAVERFLVPKCHPILLDQFINSESTVLLNVFQMCAFAGAKMVAYIHGWGRGAISQPFIVRVVKGGAHHLLYRIQAVCSASAVKRTSPWLQPLQPPAEPARVPPSEGAQAQDKAQGGTERYPFSGSETLYCACLAFAWVLEQRRGKFAQALRALKGWANQLRERDNFRPRMDELIERAQERSILIKDALAKV